MPSEGFQIRLKLEVGASFNVVSCRLEEGLSARTHAAVEITTNEDVPYEDALGGDAILDVTGLWDRRWSLKLGRAAYLGDQDGAYRYLLDLHDPAWLLGFSKNTRKFRNQSARQIVSRVLDEWGIGHRFKLMNEPPVRKYCVQYRETNLAFIERLMEFEGIFYSFDDDGVMAFGDTSPAASFASDTSYELLESAGGLEHGDVGIYELRRQSTLRPGRVTLGDYSWKTPKVKLRESGIAERDGDLELYEFPAGYRKSDQGTRLAKLRIEAQRVGARTMAGRGNDQRFAPGLGFRFGASAGAAFQGKFLLVQIEHLLQDVEIKPFHLRVLDEGIHYQNRFQAMPLASPFRPELKTPRPMVAGTHTAMVRGPSGEEIHTDTHGRFRAQLHWDRDAVGSDEDSRWVRKLQEVSTSMGLARVGWEMFLSHIDGDPDRPVGVGRAINGVAIPTYALPNHKTMMSIKTPSSPQSGGFNELSMDDSAGSQAISMRAEKDLDALVKNDKSEVIGNNETHTVGVDFVRQVTGNQTISIGGNSDATYGKSYSLNVQLDRDKKVGGSEKIDVGGASDSAVAGSDSESVGIMRITVAGSFKMPDIEAMAKSAAMQFVRGVSPGATALYDKAKGAYDTVQSMSEGGSLEDKVKDTVKGYVEDTVKDAAKDAGKAAFDAIKGGKGLDGAVDAASTSLEGSYDEQKSKVDGLMGGIDSQIAGLKDNFNNLAPTQETFNSSLQGAASTLTGGLSDSLSKGDYGLALNQAVDLFCIGSISRAVEGSVLKLVGGCFVTASLRDITWDIGYGYAELVGGVKLTSVQGSITQSVEKCLLTLVGGTVIRTSTGNLTISSMASSVMVGGAATYASTAKLELKGTNITLDAGVSLILEGGGGQVVMTPGDVTISGDLNLKAGGKVATTAALIDITE